MAAPAPVASAAVARVLDRLERVTTCGDGWKARCPAHEDKVNSLSIGVGHDGRTLLHCHAGCAVSDILTALHLTSSDLFNTPITAPSREELARYDYRDEQGTHLLDVVRYAPKDFRQQRADGTWTAKGVRRTLYRLERLHAERPSEVVVCEGEKDVDRLWSLGIPATTNRGGAGKWDDAYTAQLRAAGCARVVVLPDHDAPGRAHAETVATALGAAGLAVRVVTLPGLPDKGDVSDYLAQHSADDLRRVLASPVVALPPSRLTLTAASTFTPRAVRWLWDGRLPCGALSLLAGREAQGKSSLACWAAAAVSRGTLPGAHYGEPSAVAIVTAEDSWAYTVRPRLEAAGADLDRVFQLGVKGDAGLSLPDDLEALATVLAGQGVRLLILDPIMSRLDRALDSHKDADVRRALEPLATVADVTGAAVLGLIHTNKSTTSDAANAVMGSRAFTAVARAVLFAATDAEDESRRVLGVVKSNLGRLDVPTLAYRIEGATVGHDAEGQPITTGRVVMLGETTSTVSDALRATLAPARTAVGDASTWLRDRLADGPVSASTLKAEGGTLGYSLSAINRAREKLAVVSASGNTFPRTTTWALPVISPPPISVTETTETTETTGDF